MSLSQAPERYDVVHLAAPDHSDALVDELRYRGDTVVDRREALVFARGRRQPAAWAQNSWLEPREIAIESIGDGAAALRAIQRNWALYSTGHHRRAQLIADRLPPIKFKPISFFTPAPSAPLGSWTLAARDLLIASPSCSSPFAHGAPRFVEDRQGPPNRAYLKLWEALTLYGEAPQSGQRCLDLGAAPGGWTWVLAHTGAEVVSIDRAPLTPALEAAPNVEHRRGDAFALSAADVGEPDWICSDLIAYPERILELARYWCAACPRACVIMTVKCQGQVEPAQIAAFESIEGARLRHLWHNKHELTLIRPPQIHNHADNV